jgi:putative transposase
LPALSAGAFTPLFSAQPIVGPAVHAGLTRQDRIQKNVNRDTRLVYEPSRRLRFIIITLVNAMSRNYFSEINLHVVWHTKDSAPLLIPDVEEYTHRWLKYRMINTDGVYVHEIGGTENHVHLCLDVVPTILLADFIGQLKGASSHEVNSHFSHRGKTIQWQTGYGVVSFGRGDRDWVCQYIRNQRTHHANGRVHDRLERITQTDNPNQSHREGS